MKPFSIPVQRVKLVADGARLPVPLDCMPDAASAEKIARWYFQWASIPYEEVIAILVSGDQRVRSIVRLARGGSHGCAVDIPSVLRPIIAAGVTAFVLAHNHPSGDPTPSSDDWALTRTIARAASIVGLTLLDHIVCGEGYATSMAFENPTAF